MKKFFNIKNPFEDIYNNFVIWLTGRPAAFLAFFNNLAKGNLAVTTNSLLRWTIFFGSIAFFIIYFVFEMERYVHANMNVLDVIKLSDREFYNFLLENSSLLGPDGEFIPPEMGNIGSLITDPGGILYTLQDSARLSFQIYLKKTILQGLTIEAFGIMLKVIAFIRFVILSIRFNIPTGFIMATISYLAAYVYYIDMVTYCTERIFQIHMIGNYIGGPKPENSAQYTYLSYLKKELMFIKRYYVKTRKSLLMAPVSYVSTIFDSMQTIRQVPHEFGFHSKVYYIDPASIIMNGVTRSLANLLDKPESYWPNEIKIPIIGITFNTIALVGSIYKGFIGCYYYLSDQVFQPITNWFFQIAKGVASDLAYILFIRIAKQWIPYFIRWHSTMLKLFAMVRGWIFVILDRLMLYTKNYLIPNYKETYRLARSVGSLPDQEKLPLDILKIQVSFTIQYFIILVVISFSVYGALHAICGQYYYIPLLTENSEVHVGYRDDNSLYSGGFTSWQDLEDKEKWKKKWHGVFGRGTDNVPLILIIFDFIKSLFVKFFRLFKR